MYDTPPLTFGLKSSASYTLIITVWYVVCLTAALITYHWQSLRRETINNYFPKITVIPRKPFSYYCAFFLWKVQTLFPTMEQQLRHILLSIIIIKKTFFHFCNPFIYCFSIGQYVLISSFARSAGRIIYWLHFLLGGKTAPPKKCFGYDSKLHLMESLQFWRSRKCRDSLIVITPWSTLTLNWALSISQKDLFKNISFRWDHV